MKQNPKAKTKKVERHAEYTYRCWSFECAGSGCDKRTPEIPQEELDALDLPEEREDGCHVWPFRHWWPAGWKLVTHEDEDIDHYCPGCWDSLTNHR